MFNYLQRIGKAFMLPIAILPAAGLLLGIGGALSNPNTIIAFPILDNKFLQAVLTVMRVAGDSVFANLALIMTIGLAIGLARRDKGTAALAAGVSYIVMNASIAGFITAFGSSVEKIDTGMVGALVIGILVSFLHNRYSEIVLPDFLGFFAGSRFIPIVSSFCAIFVGALFFIVWPQFNNLLLVVGENIASMGPVGTFLYGFLLRLTGAIGLHHTIYPLFWFSSLGGAELVNGQMVEGAQKIFFAQLADSNHVGLYTEATRFFAGRFLTMMFGLPGAAFAMYKCVPKDKRAKVMGIFISVAFTSFLTGITEPLEFMFLFVSPFLYVLHAFFDGLAFFVSDILNISIGNTFSGGFIDFSLFGILQGNDKTNWILVLPLGVIWFFMYYFSFSFIIKRFNIKTPGRDNKIDNELTIDEIAHGLFEAFGSVDNISDLEACITRVRVSVVNKELIDLEKIDNLNSSGYIEVANGIQVIYGAKAQAIVKVMNKSLNREEK